MSERICDFLRSPYPVPRTSREVMVAKPGLIALITVYLQKNGAHVLIEALINFILPLMIYSYAEAALGAVRALSHHRRHPSHGVWSSSRATAGSTHCLC